jgi:cytochrome c biogenesis protein CcmG/thiol:disulfide interchange protein DsbE
MWKRVGGFVAIAVPVLALLGYGFTRDAKDIPSPLVARPAPGFTLPLMGPDGGTVSLEQLRGKVVLLNFWASWCAPCRAEARLLEDASRRYADLGVVFLGVNIQDKDDPARLFLREFGVTYPNARDESGQVAIDYGVWGIPETFFIDRQGRITYKHVGALDSPTLTAKLDETARGIVSGSEGRGAYGSVR